jgi:hypothetical protein
MTLTLHVQNLGRDLIVFCTGGKEHIGAVALARPGSKHDHTHVLMLPGHREDALALHMASCMANALERTVCVCAGIHYDSISKDEIAALENMAQKLTQRCITLLLKDDQ